MAIETGYDVDLEVSKPLREPVRGALAWLNEDREVPFELSGLVDVPDDAVVSSGHPFAIGLVVCDGSICARTQVRVTPGADSGYQFERLEDAPRDVPSLLDPPPGVRRDWLDQVLAKHEFVVLLFYRGLW